jgi:hypothetical protein
MTTRFHYDHESRFTQPGGDIGPSRDMKVRASTPAADVSPDNLARALIGSQDRIWYSGPSIVTLLLYLGSALLFSDWFFVLLLLHVLLAGLFGLFGIIALIARSFKWAIAYLIPAVVSYFLIVPVGFPLRVWLQETRHRIEFAVHESHYDGEVAQLKRIGGHYKKWPLRTFGGVEHTVVYDESDSTEREAFKWAPAHPCSTTVLKLKSNFYFVTDFCP